LALRDALFEQGKDISDPRVLAQIADAYELAGAGPDDERHVLGDWEHGRFRGVKGSPHFVCGALESFCPALGISRDESGHLHIHNDTEPSTPTSPCASTADQVPRSKLGERQEETFHAGDVSVGETAVGFGVET